MAQSGPKWQKMNLKWPKSVKIQPKLDPKMAQKWLKSGPQSAPKWPKMTKISQNSCWFWYWFFAKTGNWICKVQKYTWVFLVIFDHCDFFLKKKIWLVGQT